MAGLAPSLLASTLLAAVPWLDPNVVKPGQRGVCVTEWNGGARREIPVEVVGLLDATGPDRGAVLIRLHDPAFTDAGVVAGMSGSPVYIDGQLLGALAYGWAFAKEPLAGVTPFATMSRLTAGPIVPPTGGPTLEQLAAVAAGTLAPAALLPQLPGRSEHVAVPLAVGGLAPAGGFAGEVLARAGLSSVPAGAAVDLAGVPEPGDMIGVLLAWGDATLVAGGTVTARDGATLWGFGHPLFGLGAVRLPATRARVLAVQTSYQSSFKLFGVGKPFGTLVADRPAGVLIEAGEPPVGVPVTVTVVEPVGTSSWSFRVVDVPLLEPLMVTYLVNASLTARGATTGEAAVRLDLVARLSDGRSITLEQRWCGIDALARAAAYAGGLVSVVESSSFAHPRIAGLEVRLERAELPIGASIVEVIPERMTVRPGEELALTVTFQPYQQPTRSERLRVQVPADASTGALDLVVADGASWSEYRLRSAGVIPADFNGQLEQLALLESSSTLVVTLESRERGAAIVGSSQPAIPPSWAVTLATGLGSRGFVRLSSAVLASVRWHAEMPLEGAVRIPLTVRPRQEAR
jgi:hypothetical protein